MKYLDIKSKAFFLICISFFLLPSLVLAQHHNIKTYSVNKGLPQSQVHDIEQTRNGYIWLATYGGGLARFDGKKFVNYTTEDGLKDNLVEELYVDSDDNLWVATDRGGVATFRGDSLVYPIENDSLNKYSIGGIQELSDGSLWFASYDGGIFILRDQKIERLTKEDGLPSNIIWSFLETEEGKVWIATGNGVSLYNGDSFVNYSPEDGLAGKSVYKIIQTEDGKIWIATSGGISIWDGNDFKTIESIDGNALGSIYDIIQSSDRKIWIATRSQGIYVYENEQFNHVTEENGLSSSYIYNLFEDQNHQIWIATDEDGVNLYQENGFLFYTEENGLTNSEILNVHRDEENTLWLGTTSGIESFDGDTFQNHPLPEQYHNHYIWVIKGLPNGNKLVVMPDSTLMEFDGQNFSNFSKEYNLDKLYIYDLMLDSSDILWIGADSGLYRVNLMNRNVEHYTTENGLAENTVFHVYEDDQKRIWIGTYYGLNLFENTTFKTFRIDDGLVHNQINYITQHENGDIWIGTRGGISVLKSIENGQLVKVDNFDASNGLTFLNTHFLWFDSEGSLWQGTNGGLHKLDVQTYYQTGTMPVTHYPLSDEGLGREFNFHALTTGRDQQAWMGSMGGLVRIAPRRLEEIPITSLSITDIKANNSAVQWSDFAGSLDFHNGFLNFPDIYFPYDQKHFEFTYRGISFANPDNIQYRYKLKGFDDNWMPVTKDNSAVFTNLSPGDYTFVVQAKNSTGSFSDNEAKYSFSVDFPFWRTYWFYALTLISVLGLIFGYVRFRVNRMEKERLKELVDKQTEHLTEALKEKEVLIKEIHHRVKNNLAVISGLLELQIGHTDDNFANRVLSESQRRVQSISMIHEKLYQNERLAEIDFEKYVRELIHVITHSLDYAQKDIDINSNIDDFKLGVTQGVPCGLIINELVSNAYEHAFTDQESGYIDINISQVDRETIRIIVSDNGKGLPDDFEQIKSESLGFTLVETLSIQLEGTLRWENTEQGARFTLEFKKEESAPHIPLESES